MKKVLISVLSLLWFIEFKRYEGIWAVCRFKWWHPVSYIVLFISFVKLVYNKGLKVAIKTFDNPFKWWPV